MNVKFLNHSLKIFSNLTNEFIYLNPETYVLYSNAHIGILSFDLHHYGKWILSFHSEISALNCVETLRANNIKVTDIQKIVKTLHVKNVVAKIITNAEFLNFVLEVENIMKNNI